MTLLHSCRLEPMGVGTYSTEWFWSCPNCSVEFPAAEFVDDSPAPEHHCKLPIITLNCHSANDGECHWDLCPQIRDNEPEASGRHCPLDVLDHECGMYDEY